MEKGMGSASWAEEEKASGKAACWASGEMVRRGGILAGLFCEASADHDGGENRGGCPRVLRPWREFSYGSGTVCVPF